MLGMEMLMKSLGVNPEEITKQIQDMGKLIVDLHQKQVVTLELQRRICQKLDIDISDLYRPAQPKLMETNNG